MVHPKNGSGVGGGGNNNATLSRGSNSSSMAPSSSPVVTSYSNNAALSWQQQNNGGSMAQTNAGGDGGAITTTSHHDRRNNSRVIPSSSSPFMTASNNAAALQQLQQLNYMIQNKINNAREEGRGVGGSSLSSNHDGLSFNHNQINDGTTRASNNTSQSNENTHLPSNQIAVFSQIMNNNNNDQLLSNYAKACSTINTASSAISMANHTSGNNNNNSQLLFMQQSKSGTPIMPQSVLTINPKDNAVDTANKTADTTLSNSLQTPKSAAIKNKKISPAGTTKPCTSRTGTAKQTHGSSSPIKYPGQHSVSKPGTAATATTPATSIKPSKYKSPKSLVPFRKRIELPAEFPPHHAYRATAAYSLLRTLSKELRLSPFTLQSFLSALMLPIPSRLLGEVHVRVMRVLFAHVGMGSYAKHGRGEGPLFHKRIVRRGKSIEKGGDSNDEEAAGTDDVVE
eukprot:scaffold35078_cov23-Cyclotella_meneghiniana.AAC.1